MRFRVVLLALLALVVMTGGCIVMHPGGSSVATGRKRLKCESGVRTYEISDVRLNLVRKSETIAELSVVCSGKFEVEAIWERKDRPNPCKGIALGLFPGCPAVFDGGWNGDGEEYLKASLLPFASPFVNACFMFAPTFITLFYEPFNPDYRDYLPQLATFGLVGCYKYWGRKTWFEKYDHEWREVSNETRYEIGGFAVSVNGVRYECLTNSRKIQVKVSPMSKMATVRIDRMPKLDGELGCYMNSMVGQEFELSIK